MDYNERIWGWMRVVEMKAYNSNELFEQRLNSNDPNFKNFVDAACQYIDMQPMGGWEFEGFFENLKFHPIGGLWSDERKNNFFNT